uniref:Uncharacterized protein n=1 Tax=Nicotiana tabacum TaxID=4097 RepID=A0A1S3ZJ74_TOBAC|nr:PREDICTED: uncharacterized protein LOC107787463 [Nicotiana tabacum]
MTFVYAKYSAIERLELLDHLYYLASDMKLPCLVGGYFNVILHEDEKIGGLPVHPPEYKDFAFCVNSYGLFEQGYKGSPFTWWNRRPNAACIFKRLDRIFNWEADFRGDPFLMFKKKLKRVKTTLSKWSRETFGDIFKKLAILEDIVRVKEMLFEEEPTIENMIVFQKAQSELKKYLSIEEQYWKQKVGMTWFAERDRNISFFHNHVNGKRNKLQLKRIKSGSGVWIEDQEQLATTAVDFYKKQFTNEGDIFDFSLINIVPLMVTMEQNLELNSLPTIEEVRT